MVTVNIIKFYDDVMIEFDANFRLMVKFIKRQEIEYRNWIFKHICRYHSAIAKLITGSSVKTVSQQNIRNHTWKKKKSIAPLVPELNMLLIVVIFC